jgi:hypothetical protein
VRSVFYETLRPQLRWETETRVPEHPDRVAVIAHWALDSRVSPSFEALVRAVMERGYFVLISSACSDPAPLDFREPLPQPAAILRKPNIGYDFGSWAAAFLSQPQVFEANRVLQVNDSLLGPFGSIYGVLDDFEADRGDLWGLVRNHQMGSHLQSYFIGYTPSVLRSRTFRDFWASVRVEPTKADIIRRYEYGLSRRMYNEGFVAAAYLEPQLVGDAQLNPMITAWGDVLRAGVPFLKRELITSPSVVAEGERIPERLRKEFHIDIENWL